MRLLVIEDDRALLTALGEGLAGSGFAVDRAASAERALDQLRVNPYDLIVLDVGLPGMDGLSLLRALRARESAVPVLILTTRGEVADRVAGLDAGADDYVVKPFAFPSSWRACTRCAGAIRRPSRWCCAWATSSSTPAASTSDAVASRCRSPRRSSPSSSTSCVTPASSSRAPCSSRTAGTRTTMGSPTWSTST